MFDLPYLAARVFGTPLLIARGKLDVILSVLGPRLAGGALVPGDREPEQSEAPAVTPSGIAVISVVGTLVARSGYLDSSSGLLAYEAVGDAVEAAVTNSAVRGVLLDIDSCGGEVGGLFDLVERVNALKASAGIPIWAVANENALSAAYAIASTADRIYVTQTGEVGSIGVVAAHVDESAADAQAGLAWSFIFAGQQKVDGNPHEPLSDRARATIQADVDHLYGAFCEVVATHRSMNLDAVRATQAATYRGSLAVASGLADRVGTLDQAVSEMAAELGATEVTAASPPLTARRSRSVANDHSETKVNETIESNFVSEAVAPSEALPSGQAQSETTPAHPPSSAPTHAPAAADRSATLRAEYADIASLAAQASRLGVTIDAADAMRKGVSVEALRRTILDTLASRSEAATVIAAAPTAPAANESPIVRRARDRAAAARA